MSLASPITWLRRSIAYVPTPRTWPPAARPAVITCSKCGTPNGGAPALTTDYVKYLRCSRCGAVWSVPRPGVIQLGDLRAATIDS
jgi:hypothetical protein